MSTTPVKKGRGVLLPLANGVDMSTASNQPIKPDDSTAVSPGLSSDKPSDNQTIPILAPRPPLQLACSKRRSSISQLSNIHPPENSRALRRASSGIPTLPRPSPVLRRPSISNLANSKRARPSPHNKRVSFGGDTINIITQHRNEFRSPSAFSPQTSSSSSQDLSPQEPGLLQASPPRKANKESRFSSPSARNVPYFAGRNSELGLNPEEDHDDTITLTEPSQYESRPPPPRIDGRGTPIPVRATSIGEARKSFGIFDDPNHNFGVQDPGDLTQSRIPSILGDDGQSNSSNSDITQNLSDISALMEIDESAPNNSAPHPVALYESVPRQPRISSDRSSIGSRKSLAYYADRNFLLQNGEELAGNIRGRCSIAPIRNDIRDLESDDGPDINDTTIRVGNILEQLELDETQEYGHASPEHGPPSNQHAQKVCPDSPYPIAFPETAAILTPSVSPNPVVPASEELPRPVLPESRKLFDADSTEEETIHFHDDLQAQPQSAAQSGQVENIEPTQKPEEEQPRPLASEKPDKEHLIATAMASQKPEEEHHIAVAKPSQKPDEESPSAPTMASHDEEGNNCDTGSFSSVHPPDNLQPIQSFDLAPIAAKNVLPVTPLPAVLLNASAGKNGSALPSRTAQPATPYSAMASKIKATLVGSLTGSRRAETDSQLQDIKNPIPSAAKCDRQSERKERRAKPKFSVNDFLDQCNLHFDSTFVVDQREASFGVPDTPERDRSALQSKILESVKRTRMLKRLQEEAEKQAELVEATEHRIAELERELENTMPPVFAMISRSDKLSTKEKTNFLPKMKRLRKFATSKVRLGWVESRQVWENAIGEQVSKVNKEGEKHISEIVSAQKAYAALNKEFKVKMRRSGFDWDSREVDDSSAVAAHKRELLDEFSYFKDLKNLTLSKRESEAALLLKKESLAPKKSEALASVQSLESYAKAVAENKLRAKVTEQTELNMLVSRICGLRARRIRVSVISLTIATLMNLELKLDEDKVTEVSSSAVSPAEASDLIQSFVNGAVSVCGTHVEGLSRVRDIPYALHVCAEWLRFTKQFLISVIRYFDSNLGELSSMRVTQNGGKSVTVIFAGSFYSVSKWTKLDISLTISTVLQGSGGPYQQLKAVEVTRFIGTTPAHEALESVIRNEGFRRNEKTFDVQDAFAAVWKLIE